MPISQKSIAKRIRLTKNGKMIRRRMGIGHFRSKKSGKVMLRKEGGFNVSKPDRKMFAKKYGVTV